jgi:hypothetical protein
MPSVCPSRPWNTIRYAVMTTRNIATPVMSHGSLCRTRSSQKSGPRMRLGGRWTLARLLAIHVSSSATGTMMARSIQAARKRRQKPATCTLSPAARAAGL